MKSYSSFLSLMDLFHSALYSLGPSMVQTTEHHLICTLYIYIYVICIFIYHIKYINKMIYLSIYPLRPRSWAPMQSWCAVSPSISTEQGRLVCGDMRRLLLSSWASLQPRRAFPSQGPIQRHPRTSCGNVKKC